MRAASGQAASSKPGSAQPRGGAPAPAKARSVSEAGGAASGKREDVEAGLARLDLVVVVAKSGAPSHRAFRLGIGRSTLIHPGPIAIAVDAAGTDVNQPAGVYYVVECAEQRSQTRVAGAEFGGGAR